MMKRSVALKIFSYVWNEEDLFLSTKSNMQACLNLDYLGTFLPSGKGLGMIYLPVLCCSHHNCQESNSSAFSQTFGLQGIESF